MANLPEDPSGVFVHDGIVYVVGNKSNREVFRFEADGLPASEGVVKLEDLKSVGSVKLDHDRANDLESIGALENEMVVLSEDSRRIIFKDKTLVDYSDMPSLRESGGRGLEGMAIRELADGSSRIAVIWEGGIHNKDHDRVNRARLLMHQVGAGSIGAKLRLRPDVWESRLTRVVIDDVFDDQRFRCPDLAWCWSTHTKQWGFIILLSHHGSGMGKEKYLQVYDVTGKPIGQPQHLRDIGMPEDRLEQNWEGLCWHTDEAGVEHMLLVNDTGTKSKMYVCRVRPPANCQRQEAT